MHALVTGGAGFIGSAMVNRLLTEGHTVSVIDKLTYAGNLLSIQSYIDDGSIRFYCNDICDIDVVSFILRTGVDTVINFAAESHVDNSLSSMNHDAFVHSNVLGVSRLLDAILRVNPRIAFHQVSTDEVYGVPSEGYAFSEHDNLHPNNPYSATKAAAEQIAQAYAATYGLHLSITRCCNNMGPRQNSEKLPMMVINHALTGKAIPVYGDGRQSREWIHVDDHVSAILHLIRHNLVGIWNVGTGYLYENNETISRLCSAVDRELRKNVILRQSFPQSPCSISHQSQSSLLIEHVNDRLGHDTCYHIDSSKLQATGWSPVHDFDSLINSTVSWSFSNLNSINATYG